MGLRSTSGRFPLVSLSLIALLPPSFAAFGLCAQPPAEPDKVSREAVEAAIKKADHAHPILFANANAFDALRRQTCATDLGKIAFERVRFEADQMLPFPTCTRLVEGRRLLAVSRQVLHRVSVLAMAYRLTDHRAYLQRAAAEMRAASAFTDWNPSHFLDVAEMTLALAIGYDWLYHDLDKATRSTVADAILEKGLKASLKHTGWVKASNNWGQVCHAGMLAGALALMDQHEAIATQIVHRAITNLPRSMRAFAPKGSYPEGPTYWFYGTDFNILALSLLSGTLQSDFGLAALPGFKETANYPDLVTGPSGKTFNYADGRMDRGTDCAIWWFAKHLNRPDVLLHHERHSLVQYCKDRTPLTPNLRGNRLFALTLLWLQAVPDNVVPKIPLHWSSEGEVPITIHRTSWDNARSLFVGMKAGSPSAPHGHMDAGSFVLDADGVRWAHDLGMESYHRIESRNMNLWSSSQHSDRWRVFRLNNFSHNTLVIDGQLQLAKGKAVVAAFHEGSEPSTTLDLTPVYANASRVIRTGTLLPAGKFRIDDALEGIRPGAVVRWGMVTTAKPGDLRAGPLLLHEGGKQLRLTPLHSGATAWKTYETARTGNEWDSENPGTVMIGFEEVAPASGKLNFSVLFTPGSVERR